MYLDNLTPVARELVHPAEASNFRNHENAIRRAERDIPGLEAKASQVGGEAEAEELRRVRVTLANESGKLRALFHGAQVRAVPAVRDRMDSVTDAKGNALARIESAATDQDVFDNLLATDPEHVELSAQWEALNAELSALEQATANPYA